MVVVNNADPCVLLIIGHSAENVEIRLRDFKAMIMTMEMITIIMMTMMIMIMDTLWEMVMFDKTDHDGNYDRGDDYDDGDNHLASGY